MVNAKGKCTIGIVIPIDLRQAVVKPTTIWKEVNNIFQELYDLACDNELMDEANDIMEKYKIGTRFCTEARFFAEEEK